MSELRVAIDGTPLLLRSAGVKTYVYYWTHSLRQAAGPRQIELFPLLDGRGPCVHERSAAGKWRTWRGLALVHGANYCGSRCLSWQGRRVDLFHASHQLRNPPRNPRLTATVYDMTCWLLPQTHSPSNVAASREFARRVMRRADALIAISENTRRDAIRILGLRPEKVTAIYPGVAPAYFEAQPARRGKPYALFVGTVEPRKNVSALLDAWERLAPSLRSEFDLVIAGSCGWGDQGIIRRLRSASKDIRYLGYVPESELPSLTAGAALFVYPSLYEGFGLPVAQAMAAGVPVVTSCISSLPEIAGDAALLVDPRSPAEIRAAIDRALSSADLRARLGENGRRRAGRYRWETCAQESWALFERLTG